MSRKKMRIDLDKILDEVENMSEQEIRDIFRIANLIYDSLDVPLVLVNDKEIKSNTLLVAMYLVGKEFEKAEQLEK